MPLDRAPSDDTLPSVGEGPLPVTATDGKREPQPGSPPGLVGPEARGTQPPTEHVPLRAIPIPGPTWQWNWSETGTPVTESTTTPMTDVEDKS